MNKIMLNGSWWGFTKIAKKDFPEACSDFDAYTDPITKTLVFSKETFDKSVVVHELFHAYCRSLYVDSSDISWRDYEEMVASMIGDKFKAFSSQAATIYKELK